MRRSARCSIVLAAGLVGPGAQAGDTCNWLDVAPGPPAAAFGFGFAYDASAERIVLVAGRDLAFAYRDETWLYDGSTWTQQMVSGPPGLVDPGFVYDSVRQECVLFGGFNPSQGFDVGTWVWDGAAWSQRMVAGPPGRVLHAIAFDAARDEVVVFGGWSGTIQFDDTWVWNGAAWAQRTPPIHPSNREGAPMAYHAGIQQIVLFGGYVSPQPEAPVADTWLWNGVTWSQLDIPGPPPRYYHQMAFDPDRNVVLLWGGYDEDFLPLNDTWQFDGAQWTELAATGSQPFTAEYGLVYDQARRRHVVRGRIAGSVLRMYELSLDEISITSAPVDTIRPAGQDVTMSIGVGSEAGLTFQWLRNGAPLMDDGRIVGAQTPTLMLGDASQSDTGWYTVQVVSGCGAVNRSAVLAVLCPGDADGDGDSDFADLNLVVSNFNTACAIP